MVFLVGAPLPNVYGDYILPSAAYLAFNRGKLFGEYMNMNASVRTENCTVGRARPVRTEALIFKCPHAG